MFDGSIKPACVRQLSVNDQSDVELNVQQAVAWLTSERAALIVVFNHRVRHRSPAT